MYPFVIGNRLEYLFENTKLYLDISEDNKEKDIIEQMKEKFQFFFEATAACDSEYLKYEIFNNTEVNEMVQRIRNLDK